MNQLDGLKKFTTVVADTGDFESMRAYAPQDATTNPSLILKAVQQDSYQAVLTEALEAGRGMPLDAVMDQVLIAFGKQILQIVPGRVSTEVDARLSFDVAATVAKAHALMGLYESAGIGRERVLIKIATTWEGIKAAEILQREGIHCNMTLVFSKFQAIACADVGATLISPFVGRITDWYKKAEGHDFSPETDPGVASVRDIYATFRKLGFKTQVMGASFRNKGQVLALAGCDLLTISPTLLDELSKTDAPVEPALTMAWAQSQEVEPTVIDESAFRWGINQDAMATEKLAEGIRTFAADAKKLEKILSEHTTA